MPDLVCPHCGHGSFRAVLTTRTEYTYNVAQDGTLFEVAETQYDGGDQGDIEQVTCDDCGFDWYPKHGDPEDDYLVTEAEYTDGQYA